MIFTRPLPDEFIKGFLARSHALNLRPLEESFLVHCREILRGKGIADELPLCQTLALVAALDVKRLIGEHTLIPLHHVVVENPIPFEQLEQAKDDILRRSALRLFEGEIRYCAQCAADDMLRMGFSYWRRTHQLPGVYWCVHHKAALLGISSRRQRSWRMPSSHQPSPQSLTDEQVDSICHNEVLARYVQILQAFLKATEPVSLAYANQKIRNLARQKDILIGASGDKQLLSDLVAEKVPAIWLVQTFPNSPPKVLGRRYGAIDNVLMDCLPVAAIAITLATLFDSSAEAISYWYGVSSDVPPSRQTYRKYTWDHWGSSEFFDQYVSENGKLLRLARRKDMNHDHLREKLNQCGMPALSRVNMDTTGNALLDFEAGMSLDEACRRHQAKISEVEKFVRLGAARFLEACRLIQAKRTGMLCPAPPLQQNLDQQACSQDTDALKFGS